MFAEMQREQNEFKTAKLKKQDFFNCFYNNLKIIKQTLIQLNYTIHYLLRLMRSISPNSYFVGCGTKGGQFNRVPPLNCQ